MGTSTRKDIFGAAVSRQKLVVAKKPLLEQYMNEGMSAFNSGIRAGLTPEHALRYEKLINNDIIFRKLPSQRDVCERRGITIGAILDKLAECAGLNGHPGATRVISAVNTKMQATASSTDFIDVPDWYTRIRALHELALMAGYIERRGKSDSEDDEGGLHITIVRANTNIVQGGKVINNGSSVKCEAPFELKRAQ